MDVLELNVGLGIAVMQSIFLANLVLELELNIKFYCNILKGKIA